MLRLKAERRSLAKVSGATAPESRITKTTDIAYCNTQSPGSNTRTVSGFFRGLRFALAFDLFLIAFLVAAAYLVGYIAVHVPTAVVILGGLVLVGLVVIRGTASS